MPTEKDLDVPARIHVLLARDAPYSVIIRRGPSKQVCTVGWNLENDTFSMGQWLKGRIYPLRSDLSPDGKHLIYFAADFGDAIRSWTAISQAPYLKATGFWPKGDAWHGGGLWIDDRNYWLNDGYHPSDLQIRLRKSRRPPELIRSATYPNFENYGGEDPGVYFLRLQRDGWKMLDSKAVGRHHQITQFERRLDNGWTLRKFFHATLDHPVGKGCYFDEHELEHRKTGEKIEGANWEWAEWSRNRLIWAQNGKLFAARLGDDGIFAEKMLRDFNEMEFEPIAAPY